MNSCSMRRPRTHFLAGSVLALGVAMNASASLAADARIALPAPTGSLAVGRVTYFWKDDTRGEPNTPIDDRREVRVDVWYPAEAASDGQPAAYWPELTTLRKQLSAESFLFGGLKTHAFADAPVANAMAAYPLLVFSPGLGNNAVQSTALIEELVSLGYVVAAVDHPFQSRAIAYPDGRAVFVAQPSPEQLATPEKARDEYRRRVEARSADMCFAVERLQGLGARDSGSRFAGHIDFDRVGAVGHSIGGVAAAKACQDDARFKAAVNLDGHVNSLPFISDSDGRGPRQPFLELTDVMQPLTDAELANQKRTRDQYEQQMVEIKQRADDAMRTVAGGSYRVSIPGARHQSFADTVVLDPGTPEERLRRIQIVRDYVRAFFDKTLMAKESTPLDAQPSAYPEVTIERFQPAR